MIANNLLDITSPFKGVLLDAYGVFWGGNAVGLLPGCKETMEALVLQNKIIGILSNTSQSSESEIVKLEKHGLVKDKHYHFYITSGDVARDVFAKSTFSFPTNNKKYYLFGTPHPKFGSHHALFEKSSFTETLDPADADFIYVSIPHIEGEDQEDPSLFYAELEKIKHLNLPMVCTNPDLFAHEGNPPKMVVRQGMIAKLYQEMGGSCFYIGKPSSLMYAKAMETFALSAINNLKEILMVGDTPGTDIRGANSFGISSALVIKTGIFNEEIQKMGQEKALANLEKAEIPTFFIHTMGSHEL